MTGTAIHVVFDALAWLVSLGTLLALRRGWFVDGPVGDGLRFGYAASILFGAGTGAWLFGTLNLWASGMPGPGRSVEGALAGAIFEPFVSGRENGTGLGLALVSKIISDHDGWIAVESRPGRTTFRVSLPVAGTEAG